MSPKINLYESSYCNSLDISILSLMSRYNSLDFRKIFSLVPRLLSNSLDLGIIP